MSHSVSLCLVLHNHQPVGNFDGVIEQAYQDSYLPFLDVFESFDPLKISLHTSGPLMVWLAEKHPEYVHRVAGLVAAGRIEIIGGPFYEPILPMLPSRDRIGQIRRYTEYLNATFSTNVLGMWMPERVWESNLTADIARAGIAYTVLDDYHFKAAGLAEEELQSYFLTEDDGNVLRVFPGSERLRYTIPFEAPEKTIEYASAFAQKFPGSVLVFGDDGEKFGTWPDTKYHVYERGWLRSFFSLLQQNAGWLKTQTLSEVVNEHAPRGKVYLPDCSYREMTEWALPVPQQNLYDEITHQLHEHPRWNEIQQFIRGGNWRNFKVRYAEANEMYARMMLVSRRLEVARQLGEDTQALNQIEDQLYRGQCNCPYWHGAFGGIYLPHLRNAIYRELIQADTALDRLQHGDGVWVEATTDDYDFDLRPEVRLANDRVIAFVAPAVGGMLYELDLRDVSHNLLATIQRRPESYHRKVLRGNKQPEGAVASIHDRVVFKQEGLDQRLQYDQFARKSFLDHFYDNDVPFERIADGTAVERGDFVAMPYEAKLRRGAGKVQLQLCRDGNAWGVPLRITKALTIEAGEARLQVAYLLEGLPRERQFHFALEWNFAGMPAGADDRYFYDEHGGRLGHLGKRLNLASKQHLGLIDQWQGLDVFLSLNRPTNLWAFPIETVSQSEGGFELVHQSVCVMPHWLVQGDVEGKWSVKMDINLARTHQPSILAEHFGHSVVMTPVA